MVHFACGAWQDWPGFVKIAGRVYNPKFRGHDRRGPFTVEIVGKDHEITKGMKDFETYDELYTCLDGTTPIDILAHAKSKVDKKHHPMGFVLKFGKGRVFHSPLGHDVKAFEALGVQELFRRGAAWAGKLKPAPTK
jgi:type 1 glutamine amidotransferase